MRRDNAPDRGLRLRCVPEAGPSAADRSHARPRIVSNRGKRNLPLDRRCFLRLRVRHHEASPPFRARRLIFRALRLHSPAYESRSDKHTVNVQLIYEPMGHLDVDTFNVHFVHRAWIAFSQVTAPAEVLMPGNPQCYPQCYPHIAHRLASCLNKSSTRLCTERRCSQRRRPRNCCLGNGPQQRSAEGQQ